MFAEPCKHDETMGGVKIRQSVLLTLILFAGCVPMSEIHIQVMDPAKVTLPDHVQKLAFMNHSLYPQVIYGDSAIWSREEITILDTIMNNRIFMGVLKSMKESPLYDFNSITVLQSRRTDTSNLLARLSSTELRILRQAYSADALISLEHYSIDDTAGVKSGFIEGWYYKAYMSLSSVTLWRIYDLHTDTIYDHHVLKDTIDWYAYGDGMKVALSGLPNTVDAIREAAFNIGRKYGYHVSPRWLAAPRFYYSFGNGQMRKAGSMAAKGDWDEAAVIWKKIAYLENERIAAKASYNMALVCEMEDLLIPALDWAVKSYSIRQEKLTNEYIELLQTRYGERKKLERQVPITAEPEL